MQPARPISGPDFVQKLKNKGLPTGPYDEQLIVRDAVSFRGSDPLPGSTLIYRVRFLDRVDFRELQVKGTFDLKYCIFEKGLLLDNAEIEGSLVLDYITTSSLTMIGIIVRGQLGLNTAKIGDAVRFYDGLFVDGLIEGSLDMRGMSAGRLLMRGLRVQGDLHLGCGEAGIRQLSQITKIEAPNIEIGGRMFAEGIGTEFCGPELILSNAKIRGSVEIVPFVTSPTITREQDEKRCVGPILEALDLSGAKISGDLIITGGTIHKSLSLANARVTGNVALTHSYAFYDICKQKSMRLGLLEATGVNIDGYFCVRGTRFLDDLNLVNGTCRGAIELENFGSYRTEVEGKLVLAGTQCSSIRFRAVKVWNDVNLEGTNCHGIVTFENSDYHRTEIDGHLYMYGMRCSSIRFGAVKVRQDVNLEGANSHGIVAFENSDYHRTEINGHLYMGGMRCSSQVQFSGVRVEKEIWLTSGELGEVIFEPAKLTVPSPNAHEPEAVVPCQAGRLIIQNSTIKGSLRLSHIQIQGTVTDHGRQGLILEDCYIAGDLTLWKIGTFRDLKLNTHEVHSWDFSAAVIGDLRIRRSRIDGCCVLTFAKVSGDIDLQDSSIGGDLQVDSTLRYHSVDNDKALQDALGKLNPMLFRYRVNCCRFKMRMLCCENDIDLTGLKIIANHDEVLKRDGTGCLEAKYIEVKGDLVAYKKNKDPDAPDPYAEIPGRLNLSYANIKHLTLSAHSFPVSGATDPKDAECHVEGLILNHAQIGKLEIPGIWEVKCIGDEIVKKYKSESTYPQPIGLSNIKVDVWDIGENNVESYTNFLNNDSFFSRSTYGAVEQYFRSQGQNEYGDAIYRVMRNREWNEYIKRRNYGIFALIIIFRQWLWGGLKAFVTGLKAFLKDLPQSPHLTVPHYLYKVLLQYGTNPGRLMIIVFVLAIASLPVYMNPTNFEASSSFLSEQPSAFLDCWYKTADNTEERCGAPRRGESPLASEWGIEEAVAIMFHYHVPVAPLVIRPDWEPRSEGCLAYGGTSSCRYAGSDELPSFEMHALKNPFFKLEWPAPEDFANIMQLLNLIFWPLLLTFWIRRLLRQ